MTLVILTTLLYFTRMDGHAVWVNPLQVNTVQGAGQLGYPAGTLISVGGSQAIVRQNVNDVVRKIAQRRHAPVPPLTQEPPMALPHNELASVPNYRARFESLIGSMHSVRDRVHVSADHLHGCAHSGQPLSATAVGDKPPQVQELDPIAYSLSQAEAILVDIHTALTRLETDL